MMSDVIVLELPDTRNKHFQWNHLLLINKADENLLVFVEPFLALSKSLFLIL